MPLAFVSFPCPEVGATAASRCAGPLLGAAQELQRGEPSLAPITRAARAPGQESRQLSWQQPEQLSCLVDHAVRLGARSFVEVGSRGGWTSCLLAAALARFGDAAGVAVDLMDFRDDCATACQGQYGVQQLFWPRTSRAELRRLTGPTSKETGLLRWGFGLVSVEVPLRVFVEFLFS